MNIEYNHDKIEDQKLETDQNEQGDEVEMYIPEIYIPTVSIFQVPHHLKQVIKMQNEANKRVQSLIKSQAQIVKNLRPAIEAFDRFEEVAKPITDMMKTIEKITKPFQSISWESINQTIVKIIKETVEELKKHEEDLWCLDADILDALEGKKSRANY